MDFEKLCMMFSMQEPYYGILLSSMRHIPDKRMKTAAVGKSGNVFTLRYNPDFFDSLSLDCAHEILKHEILHIAFSHFSLWEDTKPGDAEQHIRNLAADMEVNSYLDMDKFGKFEPVTAGSFGWEKYLGTLEYYKKLKDEAAKQQQQQQQQANQPQKPCNGGTGQSQQNEQDDDSTQSDSPSQDESQQSQPDDKQQEKNQNQQNGSSGQEQEEKIPFDNLESFDDHSEWPQCESEEEMENLKQTVESLLDFAAEEVEKAQGTIPGEMKGRIDSIRNKKKPKPVADWKRYFRRYLGNEFTEFIRKSKKRESKRFPDAMGNRHRRKSHILVAIDTSGSVSMPEYREFMGQIKTLMPLADFRVVECDATIQHEYEFHGQIEETLHGGGGTDFQPVVDMFNKDKRKYDALVYFTDGYCSIPKDTPKDTLWVISSAGDQSDRNRYRVNGSSVAFIPKNQQ